MDYHKFSKMLSVLASPQVYLSRCKYLFVISHMRSRSSLLSHILGSTPGIVGHSELHRKYVGIKELYILRARVYLETKQQIQGKYVLDKILHNPFFVSEKILRMNCTYFIFLLREPEATLKSIFDMGSRTGISWQNDPDLVLKYYTRRLGAMSDYALKLSNRFFYLESDDLVQSTEPVLSGLSSWLGLESPLSQEYSIFKNTGKSGHGDPSANIGLGKITTTTQHTDIEIPESMLRKCREAYESCKEVLSNNGASSINLQ